MLLMTNQKTFAALRRSRRITAPDSVFLAD
jgi:hypothetical protein